VKRLGNQKGLTLIEVIIALAVFAAIAVSVFVALIVSTRTTASVNENTTAESLTRATLEYIKSCCYYDEDCPDYDESVSPTQYYQGKVIGNISPPPGYEIEVTAVPIDPATYLPLASGDDDGIQKVTVKVYHDNELEVTTESYKVNR